MNQQITQFRDYLKGREIDSELTLDQYETWIRRFEDWRNGQPPDETALIEFDTYLETETEFPWDGGRGRPRTGDGYAYQTRVLALSAIKLWLKREYGVPDRDLNDVQNLVRGEPAPFEPTVLSRSEIERVITDARSACDAQGCDVALQLGYDAILRGQELVDVRPTHVDWDRGALHVQPAKGSRAAIVGLTDRTLELLEEYRRHWPDRDPLFYHGYGRPWKAQQWNNHVRRKHHEAGFHAFARHSPITHRLEAGETFGDVYRRARHNSPDMTARYARHVGVEAPDMGAATPSDVV